PTQLTASPSSGSVVLRWNPSAGASSYKVKRSSTSGGPYTTIAGAVAVTNYTDTTVMNGIVYYYVVSAIKTGIETCNSDETNAIPSSALPSPWTTRDIGQVGGIGGVSYVSNKFTVVGSGADIGNTDDEFRFVYQTASGDCSIVARVMSIGNTNPSAKAGVMI